MSAREELAELLANEIPSDIYACSRVWEAWSYGTMSQDDFTPANEESDLIAEIADAVLTAGYRKPRTITTAEELDDAHMVVVRTAAGTIANLVSGRAYCFGYEASAPAATLALPVTVLWEREVTT